jgi:hypothetical protein
LNKKKKDDVDAGIEAEGSNLSGVSAQCCWVEVHDFTPPPPVQPAVGAQQQQQHQNNNNSNSVSMSSVNALDVLTSSMNSLFVSQNIEMMSQSSVDIQQQSNPLIKSTSGGGMRSISAEESEQIRNILRKGGNNNNKLSSSITERTSSRNNNGAECLFNGNNLESSAKSLDLIKTKFVRGVHLCFNREAGNLLPLAIKYVVSSFHDSHYFLLNHS